MKPLMRACMEPPSRTGYHPILPFAGPSKVNRAKNAKSVGDPVLARTPKKSAKMRTSVEVSHTFDSYVN